MTGWVQRVGSGGAALVVAAAVLTGCRVEPVASSPQLPASTWSAPGSSVVLISVDTLRADHLGCYGYDRPTSPQLDRFRDQAVLFRQTVAQAPSTLPSHASILTSLLPGQHGAFFTRRTALPAAIVTLAEVLRDAGYRTAAVTGGGQLAAEFGLDQGFASYQVLPSDASTEAATAAGLEWLDRGGASADAPFFLFLHTYEVHHPYTPSRDDLALFDDGYAGSLPPKIPKGLLDKINDGERTIDQRDLAHIVATYDAEIRSTDRALGVLFAELVRRGLYDDALIVVTADHGEEFGEHGAVGWHSHTLYDELLRVPLLVKLPGGRLAGATVDAQVRSLDLAPTVLAAVGVAAPAQFIGASLLGLAEGASAADLDAVSTQDSAAEPPPSSLRDGRWKLYPSRLHRQREVRDASSWLARRWVGLALRLRPYRLFDLAADPGETTDVAGDRSAEVRDLRRRLAAVAAERPAPTPVAVAPADATVDQLRALGYVVD